MKLKKVFIIIVIILILILLGFGIYSLYKYLTPVTVTSSNNEFSIQIPGKVDFKEAASGSSEYVLDLYSLKDQMMLYSTIIDNVDNNISLDFTHNIICMSMHTNIFNVTSDATIRFKADLFLYDL